jgi:hypothetical protein
MAAARCPEAATEVANAVAKITDSRYWKSSLPTRCAASRYCQQMFGLRPADSKDRIQRRSFRCGPGTRSIRREDDRVRDC